MKLQLEGLGKLNRWLLELNFAVQIINSKFLFWIICSFIWFIYLLICIYLFYLFIHSLIDIFISEWVLQILFIVNRQSDLIIYIEFIYINFLMFNYFNISVFACVFVCLCLCIFLLVFVCIYVLPVTSLLSASVLYLFRLF